MKRKISLLAQKTWDSYWEDDCMMLGAAVAYYSIFSLAPLLLTVVALAGLVFGRQTVQGRIQEQVQQLIGSGAAEQLDAMLKSAAAQPDQNLFYSIAGIVVILIGATGAFSALQDALNRVWRVKPDPNQGGMRTFVVKRIWSFGMIVGVVFLLIVSLIITAILAAISKWFAGMLPGYISSGLLQVLAAVSSFVIISILFGAIFRVLPDADLKWRDVWVGALLTGVLFTFGKTALGLYLGKVATASAYGAASSLVLIALWIYYACQIILLGAEFTRVWTTQDRAVEPTDGAMKVPATSSEPTPC